MATINRVDHPGYEKHRTYQREYYRRNRDHILAQIKARSKTKRKIGLSQGAAYYRSMVTGLLRQRDGDMCWLCGLSIPIVQESVDHVQLVIAGGTNAPDNLRLTHLTCNLSRPKKPRGMERF